MLAVATNSRWKSRPLTLQPGTRPISTICNTSRTEEEACSKELLRRPEGLGLQADRLQHALSGSTNRVVVINDGYRGTTCRLH
jgi:hypothetical protein